VQWVGRAAAPPGMMAAQQRGPTVWEMCRLLSGNSINKYATINIATAIFIVANLNG